MLVSILGRKRNTGVATIQEMVVNVSFPVPCVGPRKGNTSIVMNIPLSNKPLNFCKLWLMPFSF